MKVALVSTGSGNVRRGFEIFFETLFSKLQGKIDVTFLRGGGSEGLNQKRLPNLRRDSRLWRGVGLEGRYFWRRYRVEQYSFLLPLLYQIQRKEFDILHLSEYHLGSALHRIAPRLFTRPPQLVIHNGHPLSPEQLSCFDHIQQLTEHFYVQGLRAGIPPARMSLVPIGVDDKLFRPDKQSFFRRKFNIPGDALLILSVGALERRKRIHWLIEEASPLRDRVFLVIAGEGGERDEVEELHALAKQRLGDRIRFVRIEHSEMLEAYSAADVLVLCSLYEGFGIALIEAMAMALPVVCHHHPSLRWVIGEGGKALDMEKPGELVDCLRSFLDHPDILAEAGRQGRKRVEEVFSWDVLVPAYIEMYQKMMRGQC